MGRLVTGKIGKFSPSLCFVWWLISLLCYFLISCWHHLFLFLCFSLGFVFFCQYQAMMYMYQNCAVICGSEVVHAGIYWEKCIIFFCVHLNQNYFGQNTVHFISDDVGFICHFCLHYWMSWFLLIINHWVLFRLIHSDHFSSMDN